MNVVVAHKLKFFLIQRHKEKLQTHREIVLVFGYDLLLHPFETIEETRFYWLHQGNWLSRKQSMITHMANQQIRCLL